MLTTRTIIATLAIGLMPAAAIAQSVISTVEGKSGGIVTMVRADPANAYLSQQDASNANRPWVDIPGAAVTFATNARRLVLTTFSAQHGCTGAPSPSAGWGCAIRVVVDDMPLSPAQNVVAAGIGNTWFQDIEGTSSSQFSSNLLSRGNHTLKVQYHTQVGNDALQVQFLIRTYHLTVEILHTPGSE